MREILRLGIDSDRALSLSCVNTWIKQERENNDDLLFLLKGKYNEIRRNAQKRECMIIPNERDATMNRTQVFFFQAEK